METIKVTWGVTIRIWWSYFWRFTLFSTMFGLLLGFTVYSVNHAIGKPELPGMVTILVFCLPSIPVSMWVFKQILGKKYKRFSVALINESMTEKSAGPAAMKDSGIAAGELGR